MPPTVWPPIDAGNNQLGEPEYDPRGGGCLFKAVAIVTGILIIATNYSDYFAFFNSFIDLKNNNDNNFDQLEFVNGKEFEQGSNVLLKGAAVEHLNVEYINE